MCWLFIHLSLWSMLATSLRCQIVNLYFWVMFTKMWMQSWVYVCSCALQMPINKGNAKQHWFHCCQSAQASIYDHIDSIPRTKCYKNYTTTASNGSSYAICDPQSKVDLGLRQYITIVENTTFLVRQCWGEQ